MVLDKKRGNVLSHFTSFLNMKNFSAVLCEISETKITHQLPFRSLKWLSNFKINLQDSKKGLSKSLQSK